MGRFSGTDMMPFWARITAKLSVLALGQSLVLSSAVSAQSIKSEIISPTTHLTPNPAFVNTADLASSNAEEVIIDVQSVYFWSHFQRGYINGHRYVLFPDGSAKVYSDENAQVVLATMLCEVAVSCLIKTSGKNIEVPATGADRPDFPDESDGTGTAVYLANWVLAGSGSPLVPDPIESDPVILDVALLDDVPTTDLTTENRSVSPPEQPEDVALAPEIQTTEVDEVPEELVLPVSSKPNVDFGEEEECPEQGQFVPTSCAQPTTRIARPERINVNEVIATPTVDDTPVVASASPTPLSFAEQYKLRCSVTGSVSLNYENSNGDIQRPGKPRTSLGCSAHLSEQFSLVVSLVRYAFPEQQEDYDPDFTFALTYRINDTISLGYSNYSSRFNSPDGGFFDSLVDGNLRASFRLPKLVLPNGKNVACSASIGLPNPLDASGNISCGYSVSSKFRVGATAYIYLPDRQTEFQPDFSYTASYKVAEYWLLSYSNYANNRWSWNPSVNANPGIGGGSLAISYTLKF